MTRSMNVKLVCGLISLCAPLAVGCGDETIEAKVMYLQGGDSTLAPASTWPTWLAIDFAPDATFPTDGEYRLRMNEKWVLLDPSTADYVTIRPHTGIGKSADNLAVGSYTVELVSSAGTAVLTTSPLSFTAGRTNQIVVYGNRTQLHYYFFANTQAESDAVPDGSVLTHVINLRMDDQPLDIQLCGTQDAPTTADCTLAQSAVAYGEMWTNVLPQGTQLGLPCVQNEICELLPMGGVGGRCPVPPGYTTFVPSKINIVGVVGISPNVDNSGFALWLGNEYGGPMVCIPGL